MNTPTNKRILVAGYGRAGKDTAAEMLSKITGLPYCGSTSWAAKEAVARVLGVHPQVAWETRHQHREAWKRICDEVRKENPSRLIERAFLTSDGQECRNGVLCCSGIIAGCRDRIELVDAKKKGIFDHVLWIANPNVPKDPTVTFTAMDCDEIIFNDGTLDELQSKLFVWAESKGLIPFLHLTPPTNDQHRE